MDKVVPDVAQSIDFGCQLRSYKGYFLIAGLRSPAVLSAMARPGAWSLSGSVARSRNSTLDAGQRSW